MYVCMYVCMYESACTRPLINLKVDFSLISCS